MFHSRSSLVVVTAQDSIRLRERHLSENAGLSPGAIIRKVLCDGHASPSTNGELSVRINDWGMT